MMTIMVEGVPKGSRVDESFLEKLKSGLRKKGFSYDEAGIETINGKWSVWLKQTIEALSMASLNCSFIKGSKLFTIHASSDPSQFSKFERIFKKSIRTIQFTQ